MNTDRYTKVVLTVIAISLTIIAFQMSVKDAHAQQGFRFTPSGALQIAICDPIASPGRFLCADVVNGGQLRVSQQ